RESSSVRLLGFCQRLEPVGNLLETFLTSGLGHTRIHIRVLVSFSLNRSLEVQCSIAERKPSRRIPHLLEIVEMTMSMTGFAFRSFAEVTGHFGIAFHIGHLREIEVAPVRLRLAGKGVLQIRMGLCAFQ